MTPTGRQAHWDNIYITKGEVEVSWFEDPCSIARII
jgi:hypothetical protein